MRIGVDVMGGDHAPEAIVEGVVASVVHLNEDDELVLVGEQSIVEDGIARVRAVGGKASGVHATQFIDIGQMDTYSVRSFLR